MNAFDFLENMGNIDGKYILEANELEKMQVKKVFGKRKLLTYLAAALAIALLSVTVYAAISYLGIADMKKDTLHPLPQEAEPYVQQQEVTEQAQDWSCQLVETLFDGTHFLVTVGVSGGDKYIVAPTYCSPEDSVGEIGLSGSETLGEYAAKQGKQLLFVGADVGDREALGIAVESELPRNQSESEMTILVEGDYSIEASEATCQVYARDEDARNVEDIQRIYLTFPISKAPSTEERVFKADNPDAIPGIHVESVTISESPMGMTVKFQETVTDLEASYEIMKLDSDEITDYQGAAVLGEDGEYHTAWTMAKGNVTDKLTVHYYDWDKVYIGTIVFRAE